MIDSATGNQAFKSKQEYVEGFSDATSNDRWNCELFVCFTGDTKVLVHDEESKLVPITFKELVKRTNEPYFGKWALVGGALYNDEDIITGALREIKEKSPAFS